MTGPILALANFLLKNTTFWHRHSTTRHKIHGRHSVGKFQCNLTKYCDGKAKAERKRWLQQVSCVIGLNKVETRVVTEDQGYSSQILRRQATVSIYFKSEVMVSYFKRQVANSGFGHGVPSSHEYVMLDLKPSSSSGIS